jgi:triacylglycerol lipase
MNRPIRVSRVAGRSLLYGFAALLCFHLSPVLADSYTQTRHPIVLVHGMSGFDDILGISYWYRIPRQLRAGGAQVFVLQVSAFNTTEMRGEQAARQVETILATTGAEKVHLIGHSHGGPTARYVASVYPQYIASVASVGGVNWGTPLADMGHANGERIPLIGSLTNGVANAFGRLLDFLSGGNLPQNAGAGIKSLTTADTLRFNALYPEGMPTEYCDEGPEQEANGIYYYSWTGNRLITNLLDISDVFMFATGQFIREPNDGLVPSCSTHLGKVIRNDYRMNHLDEVDQLFGIHSSRDTDPTVIFRQHANRLQQLGL